MTEPPRDPRLPPRGERTGGRTPHRCVVLENRVVVHPGGNLVRFRIEQNRKGKLFAFTEAWYDPAEELRHGGMVHWMITSATTASAKKAAGWLAAVREMTPATELEIEAKRAAKRANWSE